MVQVSPSDDLPPLEKLRSCIADRSQPLGKRTHAAFYLRTIGTDEAAAAIADGLLQKEDGELLRHEFAYILGQMGKISSCAALSRVLSDESDDGMVRHEAAEALGAIGDESSVQVLRKYATDPLPEVAQTCLLALELIEWRREHGAAAAAPATSAGAGLGAASDDKESELDANPYLSVDPAPGAGQGISVAELREQLLDKEASLFKRYRAMFSLRNCGGEEAALALADAFHDEPNALFKHEVAYVLGQMEHAAFPAVPALSLVLQDPSEHRMVRHEAAEALGAIGGEAASEMLRRFRNDEMRVVKESCQVALDTMDYWERGAAGGGYVA